jgi:hypothetical protein
MGKATNEFAPMLESLYSKLASTLEKREKLQLELAEIEYYLSDLSEAARSIGQLANIDPCAVRPDLFPEFTEPELGFTDAIRKIFVVSAKNPKETRLFDPISIRDALKESGFPLDKYRNPLASIHTILRRLYDKGEINKLDLDGELRYDAAEKMLKNAGATRKPLPKPPARVRG